MGEWGETTHSNGCKRIRRSCFNVFMTPFPGSAEPSTEPTNTSRHDDIFHPYSTSSTSHFDSSLSTPRTSSISRSGSISRSDDDPLLGILPTAADADRPWLVWYSPDERIELTGHVLSMWAAKTAGLLSAEAGGRPRVHVALEPGWRALTWVYPQKKDKLKQRESVVFVFLTDGGVFYFERRLKNSIFATSNIIYIGSNRII